MSDDPPVHDARSRTPVRLTHGRNRNKERGGRWDRRFARGKDTSADRLSIHDMCAKREREWTGIDADAMRAGGAIILHIVAVAMA